ncbi:MAG: VOC family protein, partial [Bacteroidota bacterium]
IVIGINSPRKDVAHEEVHRRRPGSLHHLAFRAKDRDEVNEVFEILKSKEDLLMTVVESPKFFPQHGASYYAFFIKDPSGIKLEVMFEEFGHG